MLLPNSPREVLFACPTSPTWNPHSFTVVSTLTSPCSRSEPPFSCQDAALAYLDFFPFHDLVIWTDGSVPFPLDKGVSGVLANCSLCGTEAALSFSARSVCPSFSAEVCAILQPYRLSRQHEHVCHFSSPFGLLLCSRHSVLSSVFAFTSNSMINLAGSVFSLLLYYQATVGVRTFISLGERGG